VVSPVFTKIHMPIIDHIEYESSFESVKYAIVHKELLKG